MQIEPINRCLFTERSNWRHYGAYILVALVSCAASVGILLT